jgi:AraC-like DNA-binding protein/ligand-binding sensor protein
MDRTRPQKNRRAWVSPHEQQLRELEARQPRHETSLLTELFRLLEAGGAGKVNFADLCGLAQRIPDLHLPLDFQLHNCAFCTLAKDSPAGLVDCARNKRAVNRLLLRRREGFVGSCHLGLTDIVEPLLVRGQIMGAFFLGSVVVRGSESVGRRRIRRYCRRRHLEAKCLLAEFDLARKISRAELALLRHRLQMLARLTARLVEAWGFPAGNERPGLEGPLWLPNDAKLPVTLKRAIALAQRRYAAPLRLQDAGRELNVSADHLGSLIRQHLGQTFGEYLSHVRVNHARRLLDSRQHTVAEVAHRTGFADQAHFTKVFKRLTGLTPKQYALRQAP